VDRRAFLAGTLGLLAGPLAVEAQPAGKVYRIGLVNVINSVTDPDTDAFVEGLRAHGYEIGRNIILEIRGAAGNTDRLPALIAELLQMPVDLLVTSADPVAQAAKEATQTIPILMAVNGDPVAAGLVKSIARPGGNITGIMLPQLAAKRLELLRELVPGLRRVVGLHRPGVRTLPFVVQWTRANETAAQQLGLQFRVAEVLGPDAYEAVFASVRREGGGVSVIESPTYLRDKQLLAAAALKHRVPTIYAYRDHADAGGLISYSANVREMFRRAGALADKILQGTPPASIPIEHPGKFDLVINLKTAMALGLTIPPSVLARADEVIQ
jgi:putative ABC transport system substrate-binding protein